MTSIQEEKSRAIAAAVRAMIDTPHDVTEKRRAKEIQEHAAEIRNMERPEGRYSINEAIIVLLAETGDYYPIGRAVFSGEIPCYAHESGDKKGDPNDLRNEVFWDDLNKWIEEETNIRNFKFPEPAKHFAAKVEAGAGTTTAPAIRTNKLRRNNLDPAIDKAIKQAGNMELADVYLELKALAIDEEKPFTGALEGNALCYTADNNQPEKLTKNALGKKLERRR